MLSSSSLRQVGRSINRVAATYYPGFLFGLPLRKNEIPVFIYHDVEPESFAEDLSFLRDNGYETLSTDDFVANHNHNDRRRVLLTFDDALQNFWQVAFPILLRFNAHATLFVPTYWMNGSQEQRNNNTPGPLDMFMTWEELRRCASSGLVDVQSHAHRHALVYTSRRLVGFTSPQTLARYHLYDWPMRCSDNEEVLGRPTLGTPIYEAMPLLSAASRVIEDESVTGECLKLVAAEGEEKFFSHKHWARRLKQVHQKCVARSANFKLMSENDFRALVASEFLLSRRLFEEEMGRAPKYFAFPWMLGSTDSINAAVSSGIQRAFGVGLDFRRVQKVSAMIPAYGRFKADWLRFLPGHGRSNLRDVLPAKVKGFLRKQHFAH